MNDVTILIVDDEATNLSILQILLGSDYRTKAAISGARALEIANTNPQPDLILLDIMMPDMDGFAILEQLKTNPDTSDIPVIFLTSSEDDKDLEKGLLMGAADYLTKPIKPAVLEMRLKNQLLLKHARDLQPRFTL